MSAALSAWQTRLRQIVGVLKQQITLHNERVIQMRMQNAYALVGNVESWEPDRQQWS